MIIKIAILLILTFCVTMCWLIKVSKIATLHKQQKGFYAFAFNVSFLYLLLQDTQIGAEEYFMFYVVIPHLLLIKIIKCNHERYMIDKTEARFYHPIVAAYCWTIFCAHFNVSFTTQPCGESRIYAANMIFVFTSSLKIGAVHLKVHMCNDSHFLTRPHISSMLSSNLKKKVYLEQKSLK